VFQFAISAFLMIATGIVYNQLEYIQNKKLGFNAEQLVIIPIRENEMRLKYETFKRELLQNPNIVSVAASGNMPGGGDWGIPYQPVGIPQDKIPPMRILVVDHDFISTFQMELAAGRSFSKDHSTDATAAFMINEEAARQLDWRDPRQDDRHAGDSTRSGAGDRRAQRFSFPLDAREDRPDHVFHSAAGLVQPLYGTPPSGKYLCNVEISRKQVAPI
jgi:hypothetical protein